MGSETGSVKEKCESAGQSNRKMKAKIIEGNENQYNIFHLSDGVGEIILVLVGL